MRLYRRETGHSVDSSRPEGGVAATAEFAQNSLTQRGPTNARAWRPSRLAFNTTNAPGTTKNGEGRGIPLKNDAVLALREGKGFTRAGALRTRGADAGRRLGVGAVNAECRDRGVSTPRSAHVGELACHEWHELQELMELGGWKSYEMVLRYAHLAPEHLSSAAKRIERDWGVVETNPMTCLRPPGRGIGA